MPSDSTQSFLSAAAQAPLLTAADERRLGEAAAAGDTGARNTLIERNVRLAAKLARQWVGCGLPYDDLLQEALVGLNLAADRFKPDRGRFTTYATRWVNKTLWEAAYGKPHVIRRPHRLSRTASAAREHLSLHPHATVDEIAAAVKRPAPEVAEALSHPRVVASTDADDFQEVGQAVLEEVATELDQLSPEEREALCWRHGYYGTPKQLEEVARKMTTDPTVPGTFSVRDAARLCRSAVRKLREARAADDDVVCAFEADQAA